MIRKVDDKGLDTYLFLQLVNQIRQSDYDIVLPKYHKHGNGSTLLQFAKDDFSTMLYIDTQPSKEVFNEKMVIKKTYKKRHIPLLLSCALLHNIIYFDLS